jgi:hypothetical protein
VGRHLANKEIGIITATSDAAIAAEAEVIARNILSKPITTILTRMEKSGQAVLMYVGAVNGKVIGVAIAQESLGTAVTKSVVLMVEIKAR